MNPLARAFSGSCLDLDDHDYSMPRVVARRHVLGSGEDLFDENGRPYQPQPRTLTKVFSGSALDLNATADADAERNMPTEPAATGTTLPTSDNSAAALTQQSFNDFLDHMNRNRGGTAPSAQPRNMVLVLGGTSYLGSHIIERLLRDGYQVRATIPDMRDQPKLRDLYSIVPESKHLLFVVEANIFSATSMRSAMANCRFVIHCGVPSLANGNDVIESHMRAVMALFDAARDGSRVERIVLTGSYTNVLSSSKSRAPTASGMFDETQWNEVSTRASDPLSFARVSFEREARRLRDLQPAGQGVELTVILPAIMIGPTETTEVSEAMRTIIDFATASPYLPIAPDIYWNFVDVRDVALAHVKAMTCPCASGQRYVVTHSVLSLAELGRQIKLHYPHLTPPTRTAPFFFSLLTGPWVSRATLRYLWMTLGVRRVLDGRKACAELGLSMTPISQTIHDAVENLIANGHLPSQPLPPQGSIASTGQYHVVLRNSFFVITTGIAVAALVWQLRGGSSVAVLRRR